jgi:hypothetical protein
MDGPQIYVIIAATLFGFLALAFVLLYPIYRFLRREERASDDWTPDAIARRQRRGTAGDGATGPPPRPPDA